MGNLFLKILANGLFVSTYSIGVLFNGVNISKGLSKNPYTSSVRTILDADFHDGKFYAITKDKLCLYSFSKKSWNCFKPEGIRRVDHLRRITIAYGKIYLGTAFSGVYSSDLDLFDFKKDRDGLPYERYSVRHGFYDEILALGKGPSKDCRVLSYVGYSNRFFILCGDKWREVEGDYRFNYIVSLKTYGNDLYFVEYLPTDNFCFYKGKIVRKKDNFFIKEIRKLSCSDRLECFEDRICGRRLYISKKLLNNNRRKVYPIKGVYVGAYKARKKKWFLDLISRMKRAGLNAIVIDLKDDFGRIRFKPRSELLRNIGYKDPIDIKWVVKVAKKNGIYLVARVVVFKDKRLFFYKNGRYAILDIRTKKPWRGLKREFWVDPYSKFVWDYNLKIVKEIENYGFDEIQFDYIRFPSDGPTKYCFFRYNKDGALKREAIAGFLRYIRKNTSLPITIDIYGYNGMFKIGGFIGQDIEEMIEYIDSVQPMIYPSHYGRVWFRRYSGYDRIYHIIYDATKRFLYMTMNKKRLLTPYIQGFKMGRPAYNEEYFLRQLKALKSNGVDSFFIWNAASSYSIAFRVLNNSF